MDSPEIIAARKLMWADKSMRAAASALDDIGSAEARQHAEELRGAVKMMRTWEIALRRLHSSLGTGGNHESGGDRETR
jgi:hypothetical protein